MTANLLLLSLLIIATGMLLRSVAKWLPIYNIRKSRWWSGEKRNVRVGGGVVFAAYFLLLPILSRGNVRFLALAAASLMVWAMGFLDDTSELGPWPKLLIQILAALLLVGCGGWYLRWTSWIVADFLLSTFWIVGITNAFNLLDNMDGLAAGTAVICSFFIFLVAESTLALVLAGIAGGFLIFNLPRAEIFMGDCGAYFLGLNLACLSLEAPGATTPLFLLAVPIADTTFVTIRRLLRGKSPARGGTDHLSHELAMRIGPTLSVLLLWAVSIGFGLVVYYGVWLP